MDYKLQDVYYDPYYYQNNYCYIPSKGKSSKLKAKRLELRNQRKKFEKEKSNLKQQQKIFNKEKEQFEQEKEEFEKQKKLDLKQKEISPKIVEMNKSKSEPIKMKSIDDHNDSDKSTTVVKSRKKQGHTKCRQILKKIRGKLDQQINENKDLLKQIKQLQKELRLSTNHYDKFLEYERMVVEQKFNLQELQKQNQELNEMYNSLLKSTPSRVSRPQSVIVRTPKSIKGNASNVLTQEILDFRDKISARSRTESDNSVLGRSSSYDGELDELSEISDNIYDIPQFVTKGGQIEMEKIDKVKNSQFGSNQITKNKYETKIKVKGLWKLFRLCSSSANNAIVD